MTRKSYGERHPTRGLLARLDLLGKVRNQWRQGLSSRLSMKVLRKAGIHPWSLHGALDLPERRRLSQEVRIPEWFTNLEVDWCFPGLIYIAKVDHSFRLPENLVGEVMTISDCSGLKRLPRRLWIGILSLFDCDRIESVSFSGGRTNCLNLGNCRFLRKATTRMDDEGGLRVEGCPRLVSIPWARSFVNLDLRDSPGLRDLPRIDQTQALMLWRLSGLRSIHGITVTKQLVIHGCSNLRDLPLWTYGVTGSVTDCPGLPEHDMDGFHPRFHYRPQDGTQQVEYTRPPTTGQQVTCIPLFADITKDPGPVWTWPPDGFGHQDSDPELLRTCKALGLSTQDRLDLLNSGGYSVGAAIQRILTAEATPVLAVTTAADLLLAAKWRRDAELGRAVCLEVERMGLGIGSLAHALTSKDSVEMKGLLGDYWPGQDKVDWVEGVSRDLLGRMAGPRIFVSERRIERNLSLQEMEGPIWVEGTFQIVDCPLLVALPDRLKVNGDLEIQNCPALRSLPVILEVSGDLILENLPSVRARVGRWVVGGSTRITGVPGFQPGMMNIG